MTRTPTHTPTHTAARATDPSRPATRATDPSRPADRRALLFAGTPREVLARIVDGDPLGLRPLVVAALRRGAWMMDADRVHLRALALCARHGATYRGRPALDDWLAARVDEAIDDLLDEERAAGASPAGEAFAALARPLSLRADDLRAACARFHARPHEERRAFVRLVIERRPLEQSGADPLETARRARRATLALLGGDVS